MKHVYMNRKTWETIIDFIPINEYPILPCPNCKEESLAFDPKSITYRIVKCDKTLSVIQSETMQKVDDVVNIFERNKALGVLAGIVSFAMHDYKKPAKFVGFLSCSNCFMSVSATGTAHYIEQSNMQKKVLSHLIKVEYFSPPIPIFNLSKNVPEKIYGEVLQSFNHFHADINSSGLKLRRAIEKMCTELGFQEKNLHASISAMEKQYPREAELLHTLKLIGNEATHADSVNEEDLIDAFEVQEVVLKVFDRLFDEKKVEEQKNRLLNKFNKKNVMPLQIVNKK
jgi:hypothetical protein